QRVDRLEDADAVADQQVRGDVAAELDLGLLAFARGANLEILHPQLARQRGGEAPATENAQADRRLRQQLVTASTPAPQRPPADQIGQDLLLRQPRLGEQGHLRLLGLALYPQ